jgi:hypothetical protein
MNSKSTAATKKLSSTKTTQSSVVAPISAGVVAQCIALLGQVGDLIGPVVPLSTMDIRHALKLRKGGVQVITQVLDLCTHHGVTAVGPVTVAGMSAQLAQATALNQIGVQMTAIQKMLSDAAFSAESGSWQSATTLYTTLQRLALIDPTLAVGLQPVQSFFQTRKTKAGTVRATEADARLRAAEKTAAKHPSPQPETLAPAAAVADAGNSASAAPSGTNGAAHS